MKYFRAHFAVLLTAFALLAFSTHLTQEGEALPTQLRLSWSKSPQTSMTVVWQTALPTDSSVVEYGTTEELGQRATGQRVTYPYETGVIHETVIEGLEPGKRYHYRVGDPKGGFSGTSYFETAPNSNKDFVFTAFGDHGVGEISKTNVDLTLAEKPAFHLIMGDLSYANGTQPIWDDWFAQLEPLSRRIPVMPALGNHENERIQGQRVGYVAYLARMALPPPETWYTFDYGEARFISFNSDNFANQEQREWFVETLRRAREDKNVRWLITYQHHPLYSSTVRRLNNNPLTAAVRDILDKYKVDLVLAGHNHNYERSFPLVSETVAQSGSGPYQKGNGVIFVISGAGGKSLYEFTPEVPEITAKRESVPHYLRIKVSSSELRVEAIRTHDRTVLEEFTIRNGDRSLMKWESDSPSGSRNVQK